jgi:hypothetical protein
MNNKIIFGCIFLVCFMFIVITIVSAQPKNINVEFNGNFSNGTTLYSDVYSFDGFIYGKDAYKLISSIEKKLVCINSTINYMDRVCVNKTVLKKGVPLIIKSCSFQTKTKNVTTCKNVTIPIGCLDPSTNVYTNQLRLTNFAYSTDNLSWYVVPYNKIPINSSTVYFRVIIPSVCSPKYDMNNAIFIQ